MNYFIGEFPGSKSSEKWPDSKSAIFLNYFSRIFLGPKRRNIFVVLGFCGLPDELFHWGFRSVRGAAVSETAVLPELIVQDFPETIIEEGRLTPASMVSPRNYFLGENHLGFDGPDYF